MILPGSNVPSALNPNTQNLHLDPLNERPPINKAFISGNSNGEIAMDKSDGELNDELLRTPYPLKYNADVPQNNGHSR